jgi:hypothetical protein
MQPDKSSAAFVYNKIVASGEGYSDSEWLPEDGKQYMLGPENNSGDVEAKRCECYDDLVYCSKESMDSLVPNGETGQHSSQVCYILSSLGVVKVNSE